MFNLTQTQIVVVLAVTLLVVYTFLNKNREAFCNSPNQPIKRIRDFECDRDSDVEEFVGWNSENVGKFQVSMVKADQLILEENFKKMVAQDRGKINLNYTGDFRKQPVIQEQLRTYVNHILSRINRKTDRRFHILDIQTMYKEATFDTRDKSIINRYTTELFIQEKDKRKVSANAMNVRIVFLTKDYTLQLVELHFITDHFYKRPLVDGYNAFRKSSISSANSSASASNTNQFGSEYFRIKNPFRLQQPFFTSEDKILPPDNVMESTLEHHHRDLVTPKYRCFEGSNESGKTKEECDVSSGYWDRPVTRDEECPFFMKNKNYPNRLGGVDPNGNRCETPIGTKRIGYRYVSADPVHQPWCYNCRIGADGQPGSVGPCCNEQLNKELYPNLVSPDYAYPGDTLERGQFWKELSERGLNWHKHPTHIRDVTNPAQKNPIFNAIIGPGPGKIDLP